MGGTSSTRRITVVNDDSTGVIKISDSVVYRLKGELDDKPRTPDRVKTPPPQPVPPSLPSTPAPEPPKAIVPPEVAATAPIQNPPSPKKASTTPAAAASISAGEEYWRQKYQESRRHSDLLHRETTTEFQRGLQEVESLFSPPNVTPVCEEIEAKVLQCYLDNPKTSLNCSHQVKAFTECVDAMRIHALSSKG